MKDFDRFKILPKNKDNLGKMIAVTGFEKLLKVQKITQSGHTGHSLYFAAPTFDVKESCKRMTNEGQSTTLTTRIL